MVRSWAIDFWKETGQVTEEPDIEDGWGFAWPFEIVAEGFAEWHNSGYRYLPDPYEIMRRDRTWKTDLETLRQVVMHKKPKPKNTIDG